MILFLSTLALAGDPIPAAHIRPLTLNADGELVEGPALADLVAAPGVYDLGELYADWLLGEDDECTVGLGVDVALGVKLYVDTSTDTVYSCTCSSRCSSSECDYTADVGLFGMTSMDCGGECAEKDGQQSCHQQDQDGEEPGETETATGGHGLQSTNSVDCKLLDCEEDGKHPTQDGYHDWIMAMLERM